MVRPPEEMKRSAKEGSLIEDCSLKTAILRRASSSLESRARREGMSAASMMSCLRGSISGSTSIGLQGSLEGVHEGEETLDFEGVFRGLGFGLGDRDGKVEGVDGGTWWRMFMSD